MKNDSSTSKKPAIIFDFGGVLFDWNPHYLYTRFFNGDLDAVDRFLAEIGFVEWNAQQDEGRTFADAVKELSGRFPHHAHLIRAYDECWVESIGGAIQPTVDILESLKQAGYPLYALSNWSEEKFRLIRPRHTFLDWFDDILVSGAVKLAKPDPRIFAAFLERIGRSAEECVFIDDSQSNIGAAARLGFRTIYFESAQQLQRELSQQGLLHEPKRAA